MTKYKSAVHRTGEEGTLFGADLAELGLEVFSRQQRQVLVDDLFQSHQDRTEKKNIS